MMESLEDTPAPIDIQYGSGCQFSQAEFIQPCIETYGH